MTSRIAGALAHELNNPLQAVLSLIAVMKRDSETNTHSREMLNSLHQGVLRASSIVQTLSVLYENVPREPDRIPASDLVRRIEESLREQGIPVIVANEANDKCVVLCLAPELTRLLSIATVANVLPGDAVSIRLTQISDQVWLTLDSGSEKARPRVEFCALPDDIPVSGLSVMIDEITKLSQGNAEFGFDDNRLRAIRIGLRTTMN